MSLTEETRQKYTPTIGIECHVQLKTKTKLFSAVGNDARSAQPNSLISHIDVGLPGALPVLNRAAIDLAARAAFALNTEPQKFSKFDRKHYFYPDLPKGYQITQFEDPIIKGGYVEFEVDGQSKRVDITRVHLEEDAGKNTHPAGADYSLVDLNRAGTPLLEIVSEPQIHSAAEAKAYARELYLLMKYAGVSDVDLYHGNMRFDVNVSVSTDPSQPGKRAEVKNLNSFRSVENAVNYEIDRQIELCERGETIIQETRGWDDDKQVTTSQRGKEEAQDYRYMPEPDIPPIELDNEYVEKIKNDMPELPFSFRQKLNVMAVDSNVIEDLLERPTALKKISEIMEQEDPNAARRIAFWLIFTPEGEKSLPSNDNLIKLWRMIEKGQLSSSAARQVYEHMLEEDIDPETIAKDLLNVIQVSDESEIEKIVEEVINQNPQATEDIKNGEMKAIGFLVGQVMAKSQGKANPQLAQQIIKKQLGL